MWSSSAEEGLIDSLTAERDEARKLAAEFFCSWWSESDGPARDRRIWDEQMKETPWMLAYLKEV